MMISKKIMLAASLCAIGCSAAMATTVAAVKASADTTPFTSLTGVVTSVGGGTGRLGFTLQDATGGVLVDKGSTAAYVQPNVGDNVTILNGTKTTFSGTVEAVPNTTPDVVVNSSGNAAPAPLDFPTLTGFMTANSLQTQGVLVHLHNLHIVTPLPANAGTTTWLNATTLGQNFLVSDGTTQTVLRITTDVHGLTANWQAKLRPSEVNANDTFDVVCASAFNANPGNEISLNDPVGTAAKTDSTGPIRATPPTTQVAYSYLHTIDVSTLPGGHATTFLGDASGGLYFTDNNSDEIYYSGNPLTDTDANLVTVYDAATPADPIGSGFSFQGLGFDGTNVYASGDNGGTSVLLRMTPNAAPPTSWIKTYVTMPAGIYSGCTGVGPNTLVMPNRTGGTLNYFNVAGASASLTATSAVSGTELVMATYDSVSGRIYVSQKGTGVARGALVYSANATTATYNGAANPLVPTVVTTESPSAQPQTYQQIGVNPTDQILVAARNTGGTGSGFDLFTIGAGANLTPYATIDGSTTPEGVITATNWCYGCGFFTRGGVRYLAICVERGATRGAGLAKVYIFTPGSIAPAAAQNWEVYQ